MSFHKIQQVKLVIATTVLRQQTDELAVTNVNDELKQKGKLDQ